MEPIYVSYFDQNKVLQRLYVSVKAFFTIHIMN